MEGPSLHLAASQLKPFVGERVRSVTGNTTIDKERMNGETVKAVFAWGKHLVIQFSDFALRVHFLLFGTFEATIEGKRVAGDYERTRDPRLQLEFAKGTLRTFTCSVKFIEGARVHDQYDFSVDIMSRAWDPAHALQQMRTHADQEIADVLLDQTVFAGVGNIIKNEVLWLACVHPETPVRALSTAERKGIILLARSFSRQFLAWRKAFVLRKNLHIHGKRICPRCNGPITREKTGKRQRTAHFCPHCQPPGKVKVRGDKMRAKKA